MNSTCVTRFDAPRLINSIPEDEVGLRKYLKHWVKNPGLGNVHR